MRQIKVTTDNLGDTTHHRGEKLMQKFNSSIQ